MRRRLRGRLLVPPPGRFRRALPLIAALTAAAGIALLLWTPAGDWILRRDDRVVPVEDLTSALPTDQPALQQALSDGIDGHGWPTTPGGYAGGYPGAGSDVPARGTAQRAGRGASCRRRQIRKDTHLSHREPAAEPRAAPGPGPLLHRARQHRRGTGDRGHVRRAAPPQRRGRLLAGARSTRRRSRLRRRHLLRPRQVDRRGTARRGGRRPRLVRRTGSPTPASPAPKSRAPRRPGSLRFRRRRDPRCTPHRRRPAPPACRLARARRCAAAAANDAPPRPI